MMPCVRIWPRACDAWATARRWEELDRLTAARTEFRAIPFSGEALGADAARYQRRFARGQESVGNFTAPDALTARLAIAGSGAAR